MKTFFLFAFILSSVFINAQFYEAEILLKSGYTKEGYAKLPEKKLLGGGIKFKTSLEGDTERIEDDDIFQIIYKTEYDTEFLFERHAVVYLQKFFGKDYEKEDSNKYWMVLIHSNPAIQQFASGENYKIVNKGENISITSRHTGILMLFKRPREDKASVVNADLYTHGQVRKALTMYFKNHPEFVKRIENKEFKKSSASEVADAFFDSH